MNTKNFNQLVKLFIRIMTMFGFIMIVTSAISFAQNGKPLSLDKITELLTQKNNSLPESDIIMLVNQNKVDFELTLANNTKLVRAGASDAMLEAIKSNKTGNNIPIKFQGWYPYGEKIRIVTIDNGAAFKCNGSSSSYPGYSTPGICKIENKRTLKVKIEGSANSTFSNGQKMLKIFASPEGGALICKEDSLVAPDDPEFILQNDGEFHYSIPESIIKDGKFTKLGFTFGPGEYVDLKISACFEN